MKMLVLLLILFFPLQSNAGTLDKTKFSIGTDILFINYTKSDIKYESNNPLNSPLNRFKRLSLGISYTPFEIPLSITAKTNRLLNKPQNSYAKDTKFNADIDVSTKINNDSISLSYYYKRFSPFISYTWTSIDAIYKYSTITIKKEIDTNFKLIGLGYMATQHIQISQYYVFKNKDAGIDSVLGTGINYIW